MLCRNHHFKGGSGGNVTLVEDNLKEVSIFALLLEYVDNSQGLGTGKSLLLKSMNAYMFSLSHKWNNSSNGENPKSSTKFSTRHSVWQTFPWLQIYQMMY